MFRRLGEAEARVHGTPIESVHFHEVGAVDSIVDIVGSVLGLHLLGIEEVWCSPATVGTGTVRGAHGEMPLPAPATIELLRGFPVRQRDSGFELTTPTGAALATGLGRGFGPMPALVVGAIGYGAGDDRPGPVPNVLRVVIGEAAAAAAAESAGPGGEAGERPLEPGCDRVVCLETTVDDLSPQALGYLIDRLLEAGALDVSVIPLAMKKSRAGRSPGPRSPGEGRPARGAPLPGDHHLRHPADPGGAARPRPQLRGSAHPLGGGADQGGTPRRIGGPGVSE